ncbi:triose-phosphate isomerase, partial [Pseudoalteromonas sp. 43-MNA-CIBAN-0464]
MQAWVIGNWKQNPATSKDVNTLLDNLLVASEDRGADNPYCHLMVAPSCVHLAAVSARLQNASIQVSAQNISAHSATV